MCFLMKARSVKIPQLVTYFTAILNREPNYWVLRALGGLKRTDRSP